MNWPSATEVIEQITAVQWWIENYIANSKAGAFWPLYWISTGGRPKPLTPVDLLAERKFEEAICGRFDVSFFGEERLHSATSLEDETKPCCLVDMIDGTDLLERGFSNWCSAVLFFDPKQRLIHSAYVIIPNTCAYYATGHGAFVQDLKRPPEGYGPPIVSGDPRPLFIEGKERGLKDASVCAYTQKPGNLFEFLVLAQGANFMSWLKRQKEAANQFAAQNVELRFRFYNLAGNPMMARMPEGAVDLVFDLVGQYAHDAVAGAFIALKSGACLSTSDGNEIREEGLAEYVLHPANKISYVLAANARLRDEFLDILPPSSRIRSERKVTSAQAGRAIRRQFTWNELHRGAENVGKYIFEDFNADAVITFAGHSAIFANLVVVKSLTRDQLLELPVWLALQRDTNPSSSLPNREGFIRVPGEGFDIFVPESFAERNRGENEKIAILDDSIVTGEAILTLNRYLQDTLHYKKDDICVGCFVCTKYVTLIPERKPCVKEFVHDTDEYDLPWGPSIYFPRQGQ